MPQRKRTPVLAGERRFAPPRPPHPSAGGKAGRTCSSSCSAPWERNNLSRLSVAVCYGYAGPERQMKAEVHPLRNRRMAAHAQCKQCSWAAALLTTLRAAHTWLLGLSKLMP